MLLPVLRLLSSATFRSGEEIAKQLSISRASVHNAVAEARALGAEIHAVPGRGYRLAHSYSWLDSQMLREQLASMGYSVERVDRVESTNTALLALSQRGAAHKTLLLAEIQTAGRGRRGRAWLSRLGGGLTFSLLWRFTRPLTGLSGLSLVVGLALVRGLRRLGIESARVKWPNDILLGDRKLAGILIETQGDMLSGATAVIGVGLNVRGELELASEAGLPVADLESCFGYLPDRNVLLVAIVQELEGLLPRFDAQGFAAFAEDWLSVHAWGGRELRVMGGAHDLHVGRILGVDANGALLLETGDGMLTLHSGEVSLRPA
jgi:BirA family biotin operon repressor/biotin-[acetyl-CoA-carboxylase] ligase